MTEGKRIHDFTELLLWQDDAEMRLMQARDDHPLAWALVMAALSWDQVNRRGWRAPEVMCAQARRVMARQGISVEPMDDADQVASALEWTTQDPALLECDGQGHYRPVYGVVLPVGSGLWHEHHRAALASGALTPLDLVIKGDTDCGANPADPDAPCVSYRLAMNGDDPDAAAVASLRLAELAEERDQPVEAARCYAEVAALRHPLASPPAVLWLARQAAQNGDRPAARILAHEVVDSGAGSVVPAAWGLLGSLAWLDDNKDEAVAAARQAVDTAGEWHWSYSRQLAEMLAECGDLAGAAEGYRTLLDQPLLSSPDVGRYVQLMMAAGRGDEAVAVLARHPAQDGPFAADILLALASAHAVRADLDACRQVLARIRAHWSGVLPQVSVRADVMEASVAAADGDDARAAQLFRSLTDTDDVERRDLARPLLIASGDQYAAEGRVCLIPGVRPLLEYLSEVASPDTATWAATSLAHLATVEGRSDDAEAAVRLAARNLSPEKVTVLRALLLCRAGREQDAFAYLLDACVAATPQAMTALLPMLTGWGRRGLWLDREQRLRLRAAVEHVLVESDDGAGEDVRDRVAAAMAEVELHSCFSSQRAAELWEIAAHSDDPAVAASAWLSLGVLRRWSSPIDAATAFEHAMQLGEAAVGTRAAMELARLADRLGDDVVQARACQRALDLASGDDWAQAALRLGRINQYNHPDDAEDAYHAALAEPGARPATIGAALARLGALYAVHGNRRLAQRFWRRGKRHRDPDVADAFAAERAAIGRVVRLRRRTPLW